MRLQHLVCYVKNGTNILVQFNREIVECFTNLSVIKFMYYIAVVFVFIIVVRIVDSVQTKSNINNLNFHSHVLHYQYETQLMQSTDYSYSIPKTSIRLKKVNSPNSGNVSSFTSIDSGSFSPLG